MDDHDEQPVPRLRRDHDGAGDARRHRQAAHGHAGHRWRLRQQDHLAPAARRALPARAEAQPARPVDRVADGLPPVDVARQRALVPRRRGRGDGRRDDDRLQVDGPRRRRGVPPLRAARRGDLVAGRARDVRVAEPPTRLHAGDDEQGAVLAEPRLLADAAPLVHRADHRHRGPRARLRPRRAAQEELRAARADALRDAERLRVRLGRLPEGPRPRARPDRLRLGRGTARRRRVSRQAARLRDRLDPRLRDEQLRPVAAPQPRAPVLGEQRGGDGQARHLRRDRRHARDDAAGAGARDHGGAGRRGHPRLRPRHRPRPRRATTATGTRTPASPARTRASSPSRASVR